MARFHRRCFDHPFSSQLSPAHAPGTSTNVRTRRNGTHKLPRDRRFGANKRYKRIGKISIRLLCAGDYGNWRYVGFLTNADNSGDPAIGGTPERARTTFYRIAPVSYFDLALTLAIARDFSLRLIANNLLDKAMPILANSYDISLARSNTIPARYDPLGRNLAIGAIVRF